MEKKLTRDTHNKMVAGVAAGIANYFQLDVTWVRVAFALAAFFGGSGLWIYIILWIAVPEEYKSPFTYTDYRVDKGEPFAASFKEKNKNNMNYLFGFFLIAMGTYFMLSEFELLPYWFKIRKLWPLVLVIIGLTILFKRKNTIDTNAIADEEKTENPTSHTDNQENLNK